MYIYTCVYIYIYIYMNKSIDRGAVRHHATAGGLPGPGAGDRRP